MPTLGQLVIELAANTAKFRSDLEAARQDFSRFTSGIKSSLEAIGLGLSVNELVHWTEAAVKAGAEMARMAERLHLSTTELQQFQNVARETSTPINDVERALQRLNILFSESAQDSAVARDVLARLGMDWRTTSGATRTAADAIGEFADKWKQLPVADQAEVLQKAFGRNAEAMRNFLELGSSGMKLLRDATQGMSESQVRALKEVDDEYTRTAATIRLVWNRAIADQAEGIVRLLQGLSDLAKKFGEVYEASKKLQIGEQRVIPPGEFGTYGGPAVMTFPTPTEVPGPPAPTAAQRIQEIQLLTQQAQAEIQVAEARARAAVPGGAEGTIADIQAQITASKQLLDVQLGGIQAEMQWTETDKGRAELQLKADKLRTDALIKQIQLEKQLRDAQIERATEEARSVDQEVRAQQELQNARDVATRDQLEADKEQRLRNEELRLSNLAAQAFIPTTQLGPFETAMGRLGNTLASVDFQTRAFGASLDTVQSELRATERAMEDLDRLGAVGSEMFQRLADRAAQLRTLQDVLGGIHVAFQSIGDALSNALVSLTQGTKTASQAFTDMARQISSDLMNYAIKQGVQLLEQQIIKLVLTIAQNGLGSLFGTPNTPVGSYPATDLSTPISEIPGFQSGGVVTSPTLAMVGESGPEAIVPLAAMLGRGNTTVNVFNQVPGTEVASTRRTGPSGTVIYDVVLRSIRQAVGNGELDSIMAPYATRRVPTQR
jgi:hypothetical protein